MIKEIYQKCVNDGALPSSLTREEFLALIVLKYWAGFLDPQNMFYYICCTEDNNPSDESRIPSIVRTANRYAEKYCNSMYIFDENIDKELILQYTEEYENFYLEEFENEEAKRNKKDNSETV